tara:strand:- start:2525 stop:3571 length:1047 start_codon:yes stop_codon:yes gene_type:complete
MSFNNTPITAKIKRTTKGGIVQQPLLDMGAPVKMKMTSPAQQTTGGGAENKQQNFKNEMDKQAKDKAAELAAGNVLRKKQAEKDYSDRADNYRSNVSSLAAAEKNGGQIYVGRGVYSTHARDKKRSDISRFENNEYNLAKKNNPDSTKGYTAKEYAMAKVSGTYKQKGVKPTAADAKTLEIRKEGLEGMAADDKARKNKTGQYKPTTKKPYVKKGGKSTGNIKDYKSGSQARRDEYTARGWKQDSTTTVAKPAKTKKIDISNKAGNTEPVAKTVKLAPKTYEVPKTKTKNEIRKNKSIDKKQSKADKARANGNLKKAARKEKAIDKKKARMAKRGGYQGQAANAIKPS